MDYKPVILVLLLASQSYAQSAFDPLSFSLGARSLAMGGCSVGIAEEADTTFNNPAGLGEIDTFKVTDMSGQLLEDVSYMMVGGTYPLGGKSAVGLGYCGAYVSSIDLRDAGGTLSKRATYGSSVAVAAYGKKITDRFSVGGSLKYYFTGSADDTGSNGNGWNIDLGLYQRSWDWVGFGLVGQNLASSSTIHYQAGGQEVLPQKIKAGASFDILGRRFSSAISSPVELRLAIDVDFPLKASQTLAPHYGLEFSPLPLLALRAGLDEGNPTAGLGLKIFGLGIDYAYHTYGGFSNNSTNYFSITFDERGWGPGEDDVPDTFLSKK